MANGIEQQGETLDVAAGQTLYQQGHVSDGVYLILDGLIEISRLDGEEHTRIAQLSTGQLLGEVSVIERKPHSVSAIALHPSQLLFIPASAFERSFADPLVRFVVQTLAARLRSTVKTVNEKPLQSAPHENDTPEGKAGQSAETTERPTAADPYPNLPHIEGDSRLVATHLLTRVAMRQFPFQVGRLIGDTSMKTRINEQSLLLPLVDVAELASSHFEVVRRDGSYCVRDLGSPGGTLVNGEHLSRYGDDAILKLRPGTNTVSAGGPDSPVRFLITLPD